MIIDFKECKSNTQVKNKVRAEAFQKLVELLHETYGDDNVSIVGTATVGYVAAMLTDKDGFPQEVCCEITVKVKDWEDRKTDKKTIPKYDRFTLEEELEKEKTIKESKKKEEKEKKKKK